MQETHPLSTQEWTVVSLLIIGLSIAAFLAFIDDEPALPPPLNDNTGVFLTPQTITVYIGGAVAHPGVYELPKNSTMHDLFQQAQPLHYADIRRFKSGTKLRTGRRLVIKERPTITVQIDGAVDKPGPQKVQKGTKLHQLPELLAPHLLIDKADLPADHTLQDGECITIPIQQTNSPMTTP